MMANVVPANEHSGFAAPSVPKISSHSRSAVQAMRGGVNR
jgi:hypothetical protein